MLNLHNFQNKLNNEKFNIFIYNSIEEDFKDTSQLETKIKQELKNYNENKKLKIFISNENDFREINLKNKNVSNIKKKIIKNIKFLNIKKKTSKISIIF